MGSLTDQIASADNHALSNAELDEQALTADAQQGQRALQAVYDFLGRFVSYPSEHAHVAHTLWCAHAHMMDLWESTPRLAFLSAEPASGKTRALEVTELLVPNPVATINVSPAYLFRKVGSEDGATILYDEIDTVFGPKAKDNEDIRGLLNAGHRRGATTGRCVMRGQQAILEELPAYSAVALAGLGWLPDTILSRSVIIRMRRRHAGERVEQFRRRLQEAEGHRVRELLACWASGVSRNFVWPDLPAEIVDRDADVWESLVAVADMAGGKWPLRAREAGLALVAASKDVEPSLGIRLLHDLRTVFGTTDEMTSKSVLHELHALEELPWSDLRGKPLDERGLASRLKQYGVRSKTLRMSSSTFKGLRQGRSERSLATLSPPRHTRQVRNIRNIRNIGLSASDAENINAINVVSDVPDVSLVGGMERACVHCGQNGGEFCVASVDGNAISLHVGCKNDYRP